jgi:hypothetical protein
MKGVTTVKKFLTVLTAIVLLGLIACEGPAGPAGKDGAKGADGAKGLDAGFVYFEGFKADIKCASCHNPDTDTTFYKAAATFQWAASKHANGGTAFESGASCAECHTTEGFVQKMNGMTVTQKTNASPVGCFACHSPHKNGDFQLRKSTAVTLFSNFTGVADYTFDYGKGNLCAQCHRPRTQTVKLDPSKSTATNDTIKITSTRWYSHYGVQSQMLMGKGGYEWANQTNVVSSSFHTTSTSIKADGCTICHMTTAQGDYSGGHSMKLESEEEGQNTHGCKVSGCHATTLTSLDYKSAMTITHKNLDTLKVLLATAGWIDTVANGTKAVTITPSNKAGAIWNYFLVEHDLSSGIHNTAYANSLLRNSIAKMRGQF